MKLPLLFLCCASTVAQAIVLEWDANSETNLAGYKIYAGQASRKYVCVETNYLPGLSNLILAASGFGENLTPTVFITTNLSLGTNYFAVTAFDTDGLESDFSDEVLWVYSTNRPAQVKGVRLRKMFVQSAPSVMGPWGRDVEIAQIETASGTEFYRLRFGAAPPADPTKRFLTAPAPKGARIMPRRVMGPPLMPR